MFAKLRYARAIGDKPTPRSRGARGCAIVLAMGLAGCATVAPFAPQTPIQGTEEQAQEIEPMLETAGFQSLPAVSAEQKDRLRALPALKLGYYVDGRGSANYWMADPEFCGCLYHGDETAYQR